MGLRLVRAQVGIWRIGWQEEKPGASFSKTLGGSLAFVDGKIVENHHIALGERRSELSFDIAVEGGPVHGAVDHPGRGEAETAQAGNECLSSPMPEGRFSLQPLPARSTSPKPRHPRVGGCFINEYKPMRFKLHPGLAAQNPHPTLLNDVVARLLRGHQGFFYR